MKKKSVDFANLDTSEFDHTETLPHSRYGNANVCNENYVSFQNSNQTNVDSSHNEYCSTVANENDETESQPNEVSYVLFYFTKHQSKCFM